MAESKFFTAESLREATAVSLGFGGDTMKDLSLGTGTTLDTDIDPTSGDKITSKIVWPPLDPSILDAARDRLSGFSAKIIFDENAATPVEGPED